MIDLFLTYKISYANEDWEYLPYMIKIRVHDYWLPQHSKKNKKISSETNGLA